MKLALQIAWRFLSSAKKQTLVIILGISVGVSVQVFIGSLITGLQNSLVDTTIGSSSHITIAHEENNEYIENFQLDIDYLDNETDAFKVIAPVLDLGTIFEKGTEKKEVLLRGFNFDLSDEIYNFNDKIMEGQMPSAMYEVALGITLKNDLDIEINEMIDVEIFGEIESVKVVGFFDFNVAVINRTWGITTLETNQSFLGNPYVSSIETQLKEVFDAESLALSLSSGLEARELTSTNWMVENQELLSGLQGQSISSLMIQIFVIISVVLGISSTLAITVMQKSKQIGILKAMGIKDKDASKVFLFEGFMLGIGGAVGGVILGLGLSYAFTTFALNPDGTPVVPLFIDAGFIALSAFIALFASTLAALTPAIKSSKMTVIEVIRNA